MSNYGEFWLCGLGILVSLLLRCCTSLHPYSGQGVAPMYGDYEAQRHWQEITVNLPIEEWYRNTPGNNLTYWGLDYPPLTAYHSWICGHIARVLNPEYVELKTSQGFESEAHKLFMRYTVLLVDVVVYFPGLCAYFFVLNRVCSGEKKLRNQKKLPYSVCIVLGLLYPGLILIDHGHFQYNCVSLGLLIIATTFITCGRHLWASFCFVLALNYKQMELYHALPFFIYLLSNCVPKPNGNFRNSFLELSKISGVVLGTFAVIWGPFLTRNSWEHVLLRLFPFARGVFEDKVSNIWCLVNIFYKLRNHFNNLEMARLCLLATLVAVLPSIIDLFIKPNVRKFVPALINSSLAFFLFSFQVHEKSILLVAIPVVLFLPQKPIICFWFLCISNFSMLPLYLKDNLTLAYMGLNLFYLTSFRIAIDYNFRHKNPQKAPQKPPQISQNSFIKDILITLLNIENGTGNSLQVMNITLEYLLKNRKLVKLILLYFSFYVSLMGCYVLYFCASVLDPPQKYPDLFALLISVYSCVHFIGFFVYFNYCQFSINDNETNYKYKQE